jgi:hypothetical protein
MLSTLAEVRALVRRRGVVPMTGAGSIVDAIAGERVKGGWWGHARGKIIFRLLSALDDDDGVISVKLVAGRVTFVDRALWPALVRVATDDAARARATASLSKDARALLREVEARGEVRLDRAASTKGAPTKRVRAMRDSLEKSLLLSGDSLHTESGKHVARLRTWRRALPASVHRAARALDFDDAKRALERAASERAPRDSRARVS